MNLVLDYVCHGINIDYTGDRDSIYSSNWPSSKEFEIDIDNFIREFIDFGSISGPLKEIPDSFHVSPIGAFKKKRNTKVRVIHDLSWPPGHSINDFISKSDHTVSYTTIDAAVEFCKNYNTPYLCKTDLKSAYMSCLVRDEDRHLLGFSWRGKYYFFNCIPFGLRSAPFAFNKLADAIHYIIEQKNLPCNLLHYLDDFLCISGSRDDAKKSLDVILDTFIKSGFRIQNSKTEGPVRNIEFLGIYMDTENSQLSISYDRLCEITDLLNTWCSKIFCNKRELLSLIGKLSFCSKVVREGRRFIRRLIGLSKRMRNLHHKIRITTQAQHDIQWWLCCMKRHNGVSWFPKRWDSTTISCMFSDASNTAAGVYWCGQWTCRPFSGEYLWLSQKDIAYREMYAVVLGVAVFGPELSNTSLHMFIDNIAVQQSVNTGVCKEPGIMGLLRSLYYYTSVYNISYRSFHIGTLDNSISDSISRLNWVRFRQLCPEAAAVMRPPGWVILDF